MFGIKEQGIVHVIGPEQGYTQPGDDNSLWRFSYLNSWSFWIFSFGIGTSEVEHVLATQKL